jgi:hypothetical protein
VSQLWQRAGNVPFRIRCRIEDPGRRLNAAEERLRFGVQLYKVQRGIYLLDLHLIRGDAFSFMNSCARVIAELKVPPPPLPLQLPPLLLLVLVPARCPLYHCRRG